MLAGLSSRQLTEIYAFLELEPLDHPLQQMIAQLTDVIAKVNGNQTTVDDFMLVRRKVDAIDDARLRSQQLIEMFDAASRNNVKG